jgi:predicted nucleic acid-binding Zn ribbon protein
MTGSKRGRGGRRDRRGRDGNERETPLGEAMDSYIKRAGIKRRLEQASVVPEWEELVGPQIAAVTTPRSVTKNGTLFVSVHSSAWIQELQLMSPTILRRLGERGKKIRRVVWRGE